MSDMATTETPEVEEAAVEQVDPIELAWAEWAKRFDAEVDEASQDRSYQLAAEKIREALISLRDDEAWQMTTLLDITAIDYLSYPNWYDDRFAVVYQLKSIELGHRVRLKIMVDEFEDLGALGARPLPHRQLARA